MSMKTATSRGGLGWPALLAAVLVTGAWTHAAWAQGGSAASPQASGSATTAERKTTTRTKSLPGRGLFQGDQLSESTQRQLTDLMMEAIGSRIELALLVPSGPWQIDGAGQGDTVLNEARLRSLRRFLTDRGVDPNRIYVESRVDPNVRTPRLDVQLVTTPALD
jgi:OOP family OmpA-OmpF porin